MIIDDIINKLRELNFWISDTSASIVFIYYEDKYRGSFYTQFTNMNCNDIVFDNVYYTNEYFLKFLKLKSFW